MSFVVISGFRHVILLATVYMSDVAHGVPQNSQEICVYADRQKKLGGTLELAKPVL